MKNLNITLDDSVFKRLERIKQASELTWEQVIIKAMVEYGFKLRGDGYK